jgi:hypothetical protein
MCANKNYFLGNKKKALLYHYYALRLKVFILHLHGEDIIVDVCTSVTFFQRVEQCQVSKGSSQTKPSQYVCVFFFLFFVRRYIFAAIKSSPWWSDNFALSNEKARHVLSFYQWLQVLRDSISRNIPLLIEMRSMQLLKGYTLIIILELL